MSARTPAKRTGTRPARAYSWPPFEKGNTAAVRHGARSQHLVETHARELVPSIYGTNPHLDQTRDAPAVWRYAVALARVGLVYRWLDQQDDAVFADVDAGVVHGVYDRLATWERQCDAAEERLAIAPLTRAKLGLDKMRAKALAEAALAEVMAEGEAAGDA